MHGILIRGRKKKRDSNATHNKIISLLFRNRSYISSRKLRDNVACLLSLYAYVYPPTCSLGNQLTQSRQPFYPLLLPHPFRSFSQSLCPRVQTFRHLHVSGHECRHTHRKRGAKSQRTMPPSDRSTRRASGSVNTAQKTAPAPATKTSSLFQGDPPEGVLT